MSSESSKQAPCRETCPAGVDVPRYLRLAVAGEYAAALAVIRESIPFPAVCGYVCPGPCEIKCRLNEFTGAPEAIRALKRFIADNATGGPAPRPQMSRATGKSVAVVGSGPAGLTAAWYLARSGHTTTIFEALPEAGGMMRVGIPAYRLPRRVLDAEIEYIKQAGVKMEPGTRVQSVDGLLGQGYDAVFLALGAHRGARLGIEGEDSPGVTDALRFLGQANSGRSPKPGMRVAVVGGGNSAVDAARTALRLGTREVTIVYRRTRADMRAYPEEIEAAVREGVRIVLQATPSRITAENGHLKMECRRTRAGKRDAGGRRLPQAIEGSEFTIELDNVIAAVGQEVEVPPQLSVSLSRDHTIEVGPDAVATSKRGVFAGGDCVSGPGSVIEAIAAGRRAAMAIDRYLGGPGVIEERQERPEAVITSAGRYYPVPTAARNEVPLLPVAERLSGFPLVELPLSGETATCEARRCLQCDLSIAVEEAKCRACFLCELVCSLRFEKAFNPAQAAISVLPVAGSDSDSGVRITFGEKCDSCGLCVRYCPSGALSRSRHGAKQAVQERQEGQDLNPGARRS